MTLNADTTAETAPTARYGLLSVLAAVALAFGLNWSGRVEPLPVFGWAAAFLCLVVQQDVLRGRIPNLLTFTGIALALAASTWLGGVSGLLSGLAGAGVAFGLLLPAFAARILGAGDVKAIMALGALWGPQIAFSLLGWMVLIGGAIALLVVGIRGGLGDMLMRWAASFSAFRATNKFTYLPPAPGSAASGSMPFGVSIGLSVIAFNIWGTPWA